jgi:hypothetical protein
MKRVFLDLPDSKLNEADQIAFLTDLGGSGSSDWEDLLKSDRILIISEAGAGAGKTFECRSQQEAMWRSGDAAFFLELAELAKPCNVFAHRRLQPARPGPHPREQLHAGR